MANESEVIVQACSVITVACSSGAASLLIKNKRKHSTCENVHPWQTTLRRM